MGYRLGVIGCLNVLRDLLPDGSPQGVGRGELRIVTAVVYGGQHREEGFALADADWAFAGCILRHGNAGQQAYGQAAGKSDSEKTTETQEVLPAETGTSDSLGKV